MKKHWIFFCFLSLFFVGFGQKNPAYQLYNAKGKKISYKKMLKQLNQADIVLFGEIHNDPIAHWLQLEVTQDLSENNSLLLGAEMFEADNQTALNSYLADEIDRKGLDTLARLWGNYDTDYAALVELAKEQKIPFIATNIPRVYARKVFKEGLESLESLSKKEKSWIAPLPIAYDAELPGYKKMLEMMDATHGGENFPKAQAVKDATMAHFIAQSYKANYLFIHYNGTYHSENHEGILWYLKRLKPKLNYLTISTVSQDGVSKLLEMNKDKADFIIVVPKNMTKTY